MWARSRRLVVIATTAAGIVIGGSLAGGQAAAAASGHVHPGSVVSVATNTCEVGFVLHRHQTVFAAVPASCLGTDGGSGANGCRESQAPTGTPATISGAAHRARLVYSSFSEMQVRGTRSANTCNGNNLALLRLTKHDGRRAHGEIPGKPKVTGLAHQAPASGTTLGIYLSKPTTGDAGSTSTGGWRQEVTVQNMVTTSNLGAPAVTPAGRAVGMIAVIPAVTGVGESQLTSLSKELRFLRKLRGFHHVRLSTR